MRMMELRFVVRTMADNLRREDDDVTFEARTMKLPIIVIIMIGVLIAPTANSID